MAEVAPRYGLRPPATAGCRGARIRRCLRPGGLALVALEDDDQPGVVSDWLGAPMFFSTLPAAEERRLAENAGLEVLEAEVETQHEPGVEVPYLWLLAMRPREPEQDQSG